MAEPEQQFRVGAVIASIYRNTSKAGTEQRTYKSVRLHREFKDRYGQFQASHWLNQNDVPKAMLALQRAYEHLMSDVNEHEAPAQRGAMTEQALPDKDSSQGASAYSQAKREWDKR